MDLIQTVNDDVNPEARLSAQFQRSENIQMKGVKSVAFQLRNGVSYPSLRVSETREPQL
jgi:hypothetical protein